MYDIIIIIIIIIHCATWIVISTETVCLNKNMGILKKMRTETRKASRGAYGAMYLVCDLFYDTVDI
jgi:hypothetical protein